METRASPFGLVRASPTFDGSPPSLNFESCCISRCASLTPRLPSRADVSLDSSASSWPGCRVLRENVCTKVVTTSRLNKQEWTEKWINQVICVPSSRREWRLKWSELGLVPLIPYWWEALHLHMHMSMEHCACPYIFSSPSLNISMSAVYHHLVNAT